MPRKKTAATAEACAYVDTKVQYKNHDDYLDFHIDCASWAMTVLQVKQLIVQSPVFKDIVTEPLEDLGLFIFLDGDMDDEKMVKRVEMADDKLLRHFATEIATATKIKLLART